MLLKGYTPSFDEYDMASVSVLVPVLRNYGKRSMIFSLSSVYFRCFHFTKEATGATNTDSSKMNSAVWRVFYSERTTFYMMGSINASAVGDRRVLIALCFALKASSTSAVIAWPTWNGICHVLQARRYDSSSSVQEVHSTSSQVFLPRPRHR